MRYVNAAAVAWAIRQELTGLHRLALVELAAYSNINGVAFPAVATVARSLGVKQRQARYILSDLVREGFLLRQERPGKTALWCLNCSLYGTHPEELQVPEPRQSSAGGVGSPVPGTPAVQCRGGRQSSAGRIKPVKTTKKKPQRSCAGAPQARKLSRSERFNALDRVVGFWKQNADRPVTDETAPQPGDVPEVWMKRLGPLVDRYGLEGLVAELGRRIDEGGWAGPGLVPSLWHVLGRMARGSVAARV
jgi:hypothetical protein